MVTKQNVIDHMIKDPFYEQVLFKFFETNKTYLDEFRQELWLILLQLDENKLITLYNKNEIKYFYIGIIKNQLISNRSPFHRKFRMSTTIEFEDDNTLLEEDDIDKIIIKEKKLKYIDERLEELIIKFPLMLKDISIFKMHFYDGLNYRQIVSKTNIPLTSVHNYITNVKHFLKRNIKQIKNKIELN